MTGVVEADFAQKECPSPKRDEEGPNAQAVVSGIVIWTSSYVALGRICRRMSSPEIGSRSGLLPTLTSSRDGGGSNLDLAHLWTHCRPGDNAAHFARPARARKPCQEANRKRHPQRTRSQYPPRSRGDSAVHASFIRLRHLRDGSGAELWIGDSYVLSSSTLVCGAHFLITAPPQGSHLALIVCATALGQGFAPALVFLAAFDIVHARMARSAADTADPPSARQKMLTRTTELLLVALLPILIIIRM